MPRHGLVGSFPLPSTTIPPSSAARAPSSASGPLRPKQAPAPVETAEEEELDLPKEELLRLDDGTPLPEELTELRALLQLQATFVSRRDEADTDGEDEPDARERCDRLAALRQQQRQHLNECLLGFDDSVLFLHARLLEHEKLERRVRALRRRKQAVPAGRFRYDEGFECGDDDSDGGGAEEDWRDFLDEAPPGVVAAMRGGGARAEALEGAGGDAEEDEESLDQRLAASRQQIKACVRAVAAAREDEPPPPQQRRGGGGGGGGGGGRAPRARSSVGGSASVSLSVGVNSPPSASPSGGRAPRSRRAVEGGRRSLI